ncbi:tyrosine-protein kinase STYK1 isoform X6 [Meles meles]|uniref:tyrosine-protein kinase STYK1 isoform X6 n=1 Tax=Meles meles TaxID=9662 RepID=UPI001E699BA8|nr:tyrosine-protein kinase STYK1 isoform X6 [Meles meles]
MPQNLCLNKARIPRHHRRLSSNYFTSSWSSKKSENGARLKLEDSMYVFQALRDSASNNSILGNYSQWCSVHSLRAKQRSGQLLGDERGMARILLECSLSDKLCVVREQQYEIIIIPTILVGIFLILLAVILWLFIRGQRAQQQSPGLREPTGLQEVQDFLGRVQFYQYLGKHRNLVQLEGCCTEKLPLYMVLEDVAQGDLLSFLWTCRRDVMTMDGLLYDLTEKQVYHIGRQVLLALEFLQDKHLFHGDVAARNILIQSDLTAKLCGLGLAYEAHARGAIPATHTVPLKWLAPERLLLRPAGIRGDVWSFGILLYEMVTLGAPPYPEVPPTSILQYLQRRKIMKRPSSCTHTMYGLMKSCWRWSEESRPSLRELHSRVEIATRTADDKAVLQVPELVVPELYAAVAGISVDSLSYSYSIL